jgi:hypothetical protein
MLSSVVNPNPKKSSDSYSVPEKRTVYIYVAKFFLCRTGSRKHTKAMRPLKKNSGKNISNRNRIQIRFRIRKKMGGSKSGKKWHIALPAQLAYCITDTVPVYKP